MKMYPLIGWLYMHGVDPFSILWVNMIKRCYHRGKATSIVLVTRWTLSTVFSDSYDSYSIDDIPDNKRPLEILCGVPLSMSVMSFHLL